MRLAFLLGEGLWDRPAEDLSHCHPQNQVSPKNPNFPPELSPSQDLCLLLLPGLSSLPRM